MNWDALVVGGGPAGSSSAYHLSRLGFRVLLLEKKPLPRFKLCAGCLSARTLRLLPSGYEDLLLNRIRVGRLAFRGEEHRLEAKEEIAYIVDRKDFDHFLVLKALESGAELLRGEFLAFQKEGARYRVYTTHGSFLVDYLVGADGVRSRVARLLGYKKKKLFKSLEFFTEGDLRYEVLIELGLIRNGYLWLFPHGDGVSMGLASTHREDLFKILFEYSKAKGIRFKHPLGWHIPYAEGEKDIHIGRERVLLVGDAANMTDPLLGEGIYYALWAGSLLASSIEKEPSNPTVGYKKLLKPLAEELHYAGKIARLAYSFQGIAYNMGKSFALKSFYELLLGRKSYKELYKGGLFSFLKDLLLEKLPFTRL